MTGLVGGFLFKKKNKQNLKSSFGCDRFSLLLRLFFSSCGEQGLLCRTVHRLLIVVTSLAAERRL